MTGTGMGEGGRKGEGETELGGDVGGGRRDGRRQDEYNPGGPDDGFSEDDSHFFPGEDDDEGAISDAARGQGEGRGHSLGCASLKYVALCLVSATIMLVAVSRGVLSIGVQPEVTGPGLVAEQGSLQPLPSPTAAGLSRARDPKLEAVLRLGESKKKLEERSRAEKIRAKMDWQTRNRVVSYNGKVARICIPPKTGTSSFWNMLRQALGGKRFDGESERATCHCIQNVVCSFRDIPGFEVLDRGSVPGDVYSVRMVRNPLQRIVSAWKSKVRCINCAKGEERDLNAKTNKPHNCKTFRAFIDVLASTRQNMGKTGKKRLGWNPHWRPQALICKGAFRDVVRLEEVQEDSFAPLLKYWGAPYFAFPHEHASILGQGKNVTRAVLQPEAGRLSKYTQVVEMIYDIYDMDYRAFGYERSKEEDVAYVMQVFDTLGEECFFEE